MARRTNSTDLAKAAPLPAVKKVDLGGGEVVKPFDLSLTWKIKAADTGFAFSVYEMTMAPGAAIPIHVHPFAEFFYLLAGQVDALGIDDSGKLTWTPVTSPPSNTREASTTTRRLSKRPVAGPCPTARNPTR